MPIDRLAIITQALEEIEESVWRTTRYANDSGTCLWCTDGTLVMVPDDLDLEWFCQAKGGDELQARLAPLVQPRLDEAARTAELVTDALEANYAALSPAQRTLVELGEQLRREGYQEGLEQARRMFAGIMRSKFGQLPPMVEMRIEHAEFHQLERWGERLFSVPRAILVVA